MQKDSNKLLRQPGVAINRDTHKWTGVGCPYCGYEMKEVLKTGFRFCSNHEMICDYEEEPKL